MNPRPENVRRFAALTVLCAIMMIVGCAGGKVPVEIVLKVETPAEPFRWLGKVPVYPLGHQLVLAAEFVNTGNDAVTIEDPETSPRINMHMMVVAEAEVVKFKLHPPEMDSAGERSFVPPEDVPLGPQERVKTSIDMYHYVADRCFSPGRIDISLMSPDTSSNALSFLIEYCAESVPYLIDLVVDPAADPWIREQCLEFLGELPDGPDLALPDDEMDDAKKAALAEKNGAVADQFKARWPSMRITEPVKAYFESIKHRLN